MSAVSSLPSGKVLVAVKGAPEMIKGMLAELLEWYDVTYKWYTRRGSRVLALGTKEMDAMPIDKINKLSRKDVESRLTFAGFLVLHCPLKPDAVETLKMLADSSHRCIMITGDNTLTAVHVARDMEIVDHDALILDLRENPAHEADLVWRTVDETKIILVDPSQPLDQRLFDEYDACVTGATMKQFESRPSWNDLVQNTWVYARVSPTLKEFILTSLKMLGYTTLMAGNGTNDVGALKQAHIDVALLDGTPEDLQKIAEHQKVERIKRVYESQLKMSARFGQVPPPVPPAIAHLYPDVVEAQKKAAENLQVVRKKNPMEKVASVVLARARWLTIFSSALLRLLMPMANMEGDEAVPHIKLGDASCAAPFTSKLSHVAAS
ncbi:HAD-like protein, partial [Suillus weaverae]